MTELDILTQTLNEMVNDGELKMISRFELIDNLNDEDLYFKVD